MRLSLQVIVDVLTDRGMHLRIMRSIDPCEKSGRFVCIAYEDEFVYYDLDKCEVLYDNESKEYLISDKWKELFDVVASQAQNPTIHAGSSADKAVSSVPTAAETYVG